MSTTHQTQPAPAVPVSVSVIVPAFNCAATIGATLCSARAQTIADIELIVVDDGSRDPTQRILEELQSREPRLRVISQANAGVSAARNAGVRAARADVIAFLDSDDVWAPAHLSRHVSRLAATPHLDISFSSARFIDAKGRLTGAARPQLANLTPADFLVSNPTTTTSTLVVRRAVFSRAGLFDETLARSEDQEWLFRAAHSGARIAGIADALVDYRTSDKGLAADLEAMRLGFERMLETARQYAPDLVAANKSRARADEDSYLARRALRLGLDSAVAWAYLARALKTDPSLTLRRARLVAGVAAACWLPGRIGGARLQTLAKGA